MYLSVNMRLFTQAETCNISHSLGSLWCDWSVFTSVNGSFHAARCPSDASGLSVIEILLTVQGVVPVCGYVKFFPEQIMEPAACSEGERLYFSLFIVDGLLPFVCLSGWVRACMSQRCSHPVHVIFVIIPVSVCPHTDLLYPLLFAKAHV